MNQILKFFIVVAAAAITVSAFTVPILNSLHSVQNEDIVQIDNQSILADVASTNAARNKGLGGRDSIGINQGMLFLFGQPGSYPFWMKDMKFPIDIIWIAHGQVVGFNENIDPQIGADLSELKLYYPPEPVDKVLELHAGRVNLLRAAVGDLVVIKPLINSGSLAQ